jgi:acetolactate synthase-1/2/3 large subunit
MWAAQYLRNAPRRWISSAGLGTMGFGLPAAMGVKAALPNSEVICIAGDASVLMNIQELGTLSQYGLKIKVVIINNRWQGMVRQWQESFYDERYSSSDMSCGEPDFVKLAESFGRIDTHYLFLLKMGKFIHKKYLLKLEIFLLKPSSQLM